VGQVFVHRYILGYWRVKIITGLNKLGRSEWQNT